MRRGRLFTIAVAAVLGLPLAGLSPAAGATTATATITVTVLDAGTGRPLPAACADLVGRSGGVIHQCSVTGVVTVEGLVAGGTYQVLARDADPTSYLVPAFGTDGPIPNNPGTEYPAPAAITIALHPGGRISGRLTGWDGQPTRGVVNITSPDLSLLQIGSIAYSPDDFAVNETGQWATQLLPGDYAFEFDTNTFQRSWAYGQRTRATANLIHVTAGAQVRVDQQVPRAATVSGRILESGTGAPIAGACLFLTDPTHRIGGSDYACSGPDGVYHTSADTPGGPWVISVTDLSGAHAFTYSPSFTLTTGQPLDGFDVTMFRAATLTGTAVDAVTGAPIPGACPSASNGRHGSYVEGTGGTCSDATGRWTLTGLPPGNLTVLLSRAESHAPTWSPSSPTQARATVYPVAEASTQDIGTVAVLLGATITGRITDPAGRPVAGATVTTARWCACPYVPDPAAVTDADGRYTLAGLTPQRTTVLVVPSTSSGLALQWSGAAADPAKADELRLRDRVTTSFNARLRPEVPLSVTRHGGPAGQGVIVRAQTLSGSDVGFRTEMFDGQTQVIHGLPASTVKVSWTADEGDPDAWQWYQGATTFTAATPVPLRRGAQPAITLQLP